MESQLIFRSAVCQYEEIGDKLFRTKRFRYSFSCWFLVCLWMGEVLIRIGIGIWEVWFSEGAAEISWSMFWGTLPFFKFTFVIV